MCILQKLSEAKSLDMLPAHQIQELEDSEEWRKSGRSLQSLLIKPVQRLPRCSPHSPSSTPPDVCQ